MFVKKQHRPWIEFNPDDGQPAPTPVHYFSDRCDPFRTILSQLIAGKGKGEEGERVFVVESQLSEIIDETIAMHRDAAWTDQVVVDQKHRAFFDAVRLSLGQALAKIEQIEFEQIEFAVLDENEEDQDALA